MSRVKAFVWSVQPNATRATCPRYTAQKPVVELTNKSKLELSKLSLPNLKKIKDLIEIWVKILAQFRTEKFWYKLHFQTETKPFWDGLNLIDNIQL